MTEKSLFWTTNGIGDGPAAGYTAADFYNFLRRLTIPSNEKSQGVLRGVRNELAVSGMSSPITVADGAAIVYGLLYENSAPLNLAVGIPINGITGGRVNLKVDWGKQEVRTAVQLNTDGVATIPTLVQTAGSEWSISLATFTINPAGQIALADAREFCQFASRFAPGAIGDLTGLSVVGRATSSRGAAAAIIAGSDGQVLRRSGSLLEFGQVSSAGIADAAVTVDKLGEIEDIGEFVTTANIADNAIDDTKVGDRVPQFYRRQGGSAGDWTVTGTDDYTPGAVRMQAGIISVSIPSGYQYGDKEITFPVSFADKPLVFLAYVEQDTQQYIASCKSVSDNKFTATAWGPSNSQVKISWLAIGPE